MTDQVMNGTVPAPVEVVVSTPEKQPKKKKIDHLSKEKLSRLIYRTLEDKGKCTIKDLQATPALSHISDYRVSSALADLALDHKVERIGTKGTGGQIVYGLVIDQVEPAKEMAPAQPDLPMFEIKVFEDHVELSHEAMSGILAAFASQS